MYPPIRVRGSTRVVGLIGGNIDHSLSPRMHNAAFAAAGLDWVYVPLRVEPGELAAAIGGLPALGLCGANVTMPYKCQVLDLLGGVDEVAAAAGAVNCLVAQAGGGLLGTNTDVPGFTAALHRVGIRCDERPALLLGGGGAARAVVYALLASGCPEVIVLNRTKERAEALVRDLRPVGGQRLRFGGSLAQADTFACSESILVNSIPLGSDAGATPQAAGWPPRCIFQPGQVVIDLVYTPRQTPFLHAAREAGVTQMVDGVALLAEQAALSFSAWTGLAPPTEVMLRAGNLETAM